MCSAFLKALNLIIILLIYSIDLREFKNEKEPMMPLNIADEMNRIQPSQKQEMQERG